MKFFPEAKVKRILSLLPLTQGFVTALAVTDAFSAANEHGSRSHLQTICPEGRRTLKAVCAVAVLLLAVVPARATDSCKFTPGQKSITVTLQNYPNAFEPLCQPTRIRVDDRTPVTLRLENLSPIEICTPAAKAPSPNAVTNPLESIINSVVGLKAFDFAQHLDFAEYTKDLGKLDEVMGIAPRTPVVNRPPLPPPTGTESPDEKALRLFNDIAGQVLESAQEVSQKQTVWQGNYKKDNDDMITYLAADYRGSKYHNFDPDIDAALAAVRAHVALGAIALDAYTNAYPPNELDYAELQMLTDEMKSLQSRLNNNCSTADKPACNADILHTTTHLIDQANAFLSIVQDNFKTLQTMQGALVTNFATLHKIKVDFQNRLNAGQIKTDGTILYQDFQLASDYGAADAGSISCSSDTTPAVATTDAINYSVTFQNVPAFTVSSGLLTTFLQKNVYGVTQQLDTTTTPPSTDTVFVVTDSARASVFPMAYVNYRTGRPALKTWWGEPYNELIIAHNVSAGIGINPNTGTNQVEFFAGDAISFGRVLIHAGAHFGRTQSLAGGFSLGKVPSGFSGTTAPVEWGYHPAFAIGLSVRIAPF